MCTLVKSDSNNGVDVFRSRISLRAASMLSWDWRVPVVSGVNLA